MTNLTPAELLAQSLPSTCPDLWVRVFEEKGALELKREFLAKNAVDLDAHPDRPTEILNAYVRSHSGVGGVQVGDALNVPPVPPPDRLDQAWPETAPGDMGAADLAARLVACGARPFSKPHHNTPDLLDVALRMGWGGLVLQLLKRPDLPLGHALQGRVSDRKEGKGRLPWTHALALVGRVAELQAWLSLPGMNPNAVDDRGRSSLFYAATPEVIQALYSAGANPLMTDQEGRSPLEVWEGPDEAGSSMIRDRAALIAALKDLPEVASLPISVRLNQWLKEGPESWASLPPEVQAGLQSRRLPSVPVYGAEGGGVAWGVLGHLALRLESTCPPLGREALMNAWLAFGAEVPRAVLDHESLPGVADGWLVIAALWRWRQHMTASEKNTILLTHKAIEVWSHRLLGHLLQPQKAQMWRMGLLEAVSALAKKRTAPDWVSDQVADLLNPSVRGWPDHGLSRSVRRALAMKALATPAIRKQVADEALSIIDVLADHSQHVGPTDPPADDLWQGLLGLYHEHCRRQNSTSRAGTLGQDMRAKLEGIMQAWLEGGLLPRDLKDQSARAALTTLRRRTPALWTALMACRMADRMERAVPDAMEGPLVARPRM